MGHMASKEDILGQFFTKKGVVKRILNLVFEYKDYGKGIRILEPSSGTGNFVSVMSGMGFRNIDECEIDGGLTKKPLDFFNLPTDRKYDFIIGNPPFTKYNVEESYYHRASYMKDFNVHPGSYLTKSMLKRRKERIENVFIMKSLRHIKDDESSIGFILPISFFIKNRNREIKAELSKRFSTIVIYQDSRVWFNYNIPCCFALFTNSEGNRDKIILIYENEKCVIGKSKIYDEIIPQVFFNRKNGIARNGSGKPLAEFLDSAPVRYGMSYTENNVSARNILERTRIPKEGKAEDYKLAIVRVGNASVGKCGLVNTKKDVLNGMFFVFGFRDDYDKSKEMKEKTCHLINQRQDYFKNITCRVGAMSIKKSDVLDFRIRIQ